MAPLNLRILKGFTIIMKGLLSGHVWSISDEHECNWTYQCKPCWEDGQRVGKRIFAGKFNILSSITEMLIWSDCLFAMCPTAAPLQGSHSLEKVLEFLGKSLKSP